MRRVPKPGDVVYIASRNSCGERGRHPMTIPATVTKVGRLYFYCGDRAFEIDSFVDGAWRDRYGDFGWGHECDAYISQEVYDKVRSKWKRIQEIQRADMGNWSCAKVSAVYTAVFASPDMAGAEEWEAPPA